MGKNESMEQTALREVFEKTGLKVTLISDFKADIEYKLTNNSKREVTFFIDIGENQSVNIQQSEIVDFKWRKYDDITCLLTFDNSEQILLDIKNFLENMR